jgi:ribose transport system ATP-binding protein
LTKPILSTRSVRKSFGGVEVLHGVDLDAVGGSVLALVGENGAGKSTLVKIIAGDLEPDSGSIEIGDQQFRSLDPLHARQIGIRIILQELSDAPELTIAENVVMGRWPKKRRVVDWRATREMARRALDALGVDLDVDTPVAALRIGERQAVEIARALSDEARCLILDEPTAALAAREVEALFEAVDRLRERGVAVIYITHRLDEVGRIADRVQVLRDGDTVVTAPASELSRADLVSAMVGRRMEEVDRPERVEVDREQAPILRFARATSAKSFRDVDLEVYPGEVVALYGKVGSGNSAVLEAAFGLGSLEEGVIEVNGKQVSHPTVRMAIEGGIGLLPGDRKREGAFMTLSVASNLCAPSWPQLARAGLITAKREASVFRRWRETLKIQSRDDPSQLIGTLSGGNQQKVMLGRWLERDSRILLLIEPTRGVDVGARRDIYRSVREIARQGVGVLVATSDAEEVIQLADRAVVMDRGSVVNALDFEQVTFTRLLQVTGDA